MIRFIVGPLVLILLSIVGLSFYFQLDNLKNCGEKPNSIIGCQSVDAIVAISGGDTDARTNTAIDLYKNGWAKTIVFSGAAQDKTGPSNASVMKNIAIKSGVAESNIFIDEYSATTKQNADNCDAIFKKEDIKSIILVTSGYHQRRASLEFNRHATGVKIINHPTRNDKDWNWAWFINPRGWWLATNEVAKTFVFYIEGIWR